MLCTLHFFSSKCSLFHNANLFGSCVIHILYTGCAKIKKKCFRRQRVKLSKYVLDDRVRSLLGALAPTPLRHYGQTVSGG
jgi:hypothetical protein